MASGSSIGGSWDYTDSSAVDPYAGVRDSVSVTLNMATFCSYYSSASGLAGVKLSLAGSYWPNDEIDWYEGDDFYFYFPISKVGAPTSPKVAATISRTAVELSWGAGSSVDGNSVTGYDVQYRESSDGSSWGSWTTASGSPVTATSLSVVPSATVGNYRQYRVRTRGSAGESYYSAWVTSTNTLRRKWAAFGAWTDATLTAGVSGIRAVHLTQLQERVNMIRVFFGLGAFAFTVITARKTKIALWASLIQEIRDAIDGITTAHDSWNTLETGKPRIAHITQIRSIIDGM